MFGSKLQPAHCTLGDRALRRPQQDQTTQTAFQPLFSRPERLLRVANNNELLQGNAAARQSLRAGYPGWGGENDRQSGLGLLGHQRQQQSKLAQPETFRHQFDQLAAGPALIRQPAIQIRAARRQRW